MNTSECDCHLANCNPESTQPKKLLKRRHYTNLYLGPLICIHISTGHSLRHCVRFHLQLIVPEQSSRAVPDLKENGDFFLWYAWRQGPWVSRQLLLLLTKGTFFCSSFAKMQTSSGILYVLKYFTSTLVIDEGIIILSRKSIPYLEQPVNRYCDIVPVSKPGKVSPYSPISMFKGSF